MDKAARVIALLADSDEPLSLAQITKSLALPKSTVFGICASLVANDLIERNAADRYELGARLVSLGRAYSSQLDLAEEFRRRYVEFDWPPTSTVILATLDEVRSVYLARRAGSSPIGHSTVGWTLPAYTTATGRAILAFRTEAEVSTLLARYPLDGASYPDGSSEAAFWGELASTRERGYSIDDEATVTGIYAVGIPIFAARGRAVAAVAMSNLKGRPLDDIFAHLGDLYDLASLLTHASGGIQPTHRPTPTPAP
nr:IclR family transcriptional regulator C-terminal domain-containing protein [Microtetraspora sp. NBRC 16547]